ncbi:transglutaminase-like domain-containing protein [Nonomuraea fuscirosea]|uniref:transglutaminase-like domain-containing protein n=1 Tax=Nonomuraea fuscirosea TaxID=1291556 RepID=UPI0034323F1F
MRRFEPSTLTFYARPSTTTAVGRFQPQIERLPRDIAPLAAVAQTLLVHEHLAPAYGVMLSDEDRGSAHLRSMERLMERITARDGRPLDTPRVAASRIAGNCWHYAVLLVAMLRVLGTPARARCGFGGYFTEGRFEDHWVCEYWDEEQRRWILVDAQIDERHRVMFPVDFDPLDVPRDRFLVAGQAWARCRAGAADPDTFGFSFTRTGGYWYIASNLMRDAAALQRLEVLPDDTWAAMPEPGQAIGDELAALFDHLGTLTQAPDAAFAELRRLCRSDDRLRVPPAMLRVPPAMRAESGHRTAASTVRN